MKAEQVAGRDESEDDLYEMANLYPRDTGLPMTIWVIYPVAQGAWGFCLPM